MDPSAMYVQHDWSPQTWAVMLAVMVTLVGAAICVMLVAVMRIDAASARHVPQDEPRRLPAPDDAADAETRRPLAAAS